MSSEPSHLHSELGSPQKARPTVLMQDVCKAFGATMVLRNISLSVEAGEVVVICGPSGSGKSTLIRTVNGLERHDSGKIEVCGTTLTADVRTAQRVRLNVGMVFQSFNLFPHLTVIENVMLALQTVHKLSQAAAKERALVYLERVHIATHAYKYPAQISGGQKQRVAIARALALQPKVMLFDEPTSALDPEMIKEVLDVMRELASQEMTMLCVTHEMGFAREVAHRIVFIDNGEMIEEAAPQEFFENPRHERTQKFLSQILRH